MYTLLDVWLGAYTYPGSAQTTSEHSSDGPMQTSMVSYNFVVHKTKSLFSPIVLDHAHEHVNAGVKGEGGAVGLTENPAALCRWMVAGPELSRMIEEFKGSVSSTVVHGHREQNPAFKNAFATDVHH